MSQPTFSWGVMGPKSYASLVESTARINIWHGAVRAGKTIDSIVRFIEFVKRHEAQGEMLMVGRTERTLKRNILDVIESMVGSRHFRFSIGNGEAWLYGRRIYIAGASDARAEGKIRGMTLCGAYGDEATLWPEDFFKMLLSRLSVDSAKLFITTNPASPRHWLYDEYICNHTLNLRHWQYQLDDNKNLSPAYVKNLKAEYKGVWYRRYILGEWCVADGLIYPMFDPAGHVTDDLPKMRSIQFAVDVGHSNATAFLALGDGADGRAYVLAEYYHSGKKTGRTLSPLSYAKMFIHFRDALHEEFASAARGRVYIDPSALGFRAQLRELGETYTVSANNDVVAGIQTVASVIDGDLLRVRSRCRNLLDELASYAWDDKAAERGEDRPIKENDHACDALRYCLHTQRAEYRARKVIENV